jgi:L-histidine Nalpha-methyltransferase / hercynylcysteine S-oxide synthase
MLLQRAGTGTIPPPEFVAPSWESLARTWNTGSKPATPTVTLGPADVVLGSDDFEADDGKPELATSVDGIRFGWDNESPRRTVKVGQFRAEWRPITNGEFFDFWKGEGKDKVSFPCSWIKDGESIQVRIRFISTRSAV